MLDALKRASAERITAVDPVLRLRAPGSQGRAAHADQRQAGRRPDHHRRRVARADDRSARRSDPGLLQHPGRQPLRDAGPAAVPARAPRRRGRSTVVSPDAGGVERARAFAKRLDASLAIIDKRRSRANEVAEMHIIGEVDGTDRHHRRRHGRHRGHALQPRPRRVRERARRRCSPAARTPCCPGRRSSASRRRRSTSSSSPTRSRSRRRRGACRKITRAVGRAAARRGDPPHPRRGIDQLALRLRGRGPADGDRCEESRIDQRSSTRDEPGKGRARTCAAAARSRRSSTARSARRRRSTSTRRSSQARSRPRGLAPDPPRVRARAETRRAHGAGARDAAPPGDRGRPARRLLRGRPHDEAPSCRVPLHFVGKAVGVAAGGILQPILREIEVECLPTEIPEFIEVDVSALGIHDAVHVAELQAPRASSRSRRHRGHGAAADGRGGEGRRGRSRRGARRRRSRGRQRPPGRRQAEPWPEGWRRGVRSVGRRRARQPGSRYAVPGTTWAFVSSTALRSAGMPTSGAPIPRMRRRRGRRRRARAAGEAADVHEPQRRGAVRRFQLRPAPARLVVVYDDLDLPCGQIRVRRRGGSAGHRGIDSIVDASAPSSSAYASVSAGRRRGRRGGATYWRRCRRGAQCRCVADVERAGDAVECVVRDGVASGDESLQYARRDRRTDD